MLQLLRKDAKTGRMLQVQSGVRDAGRVEMTAAEWIAIPDNPRQRDTEAHAKKAKHLRTLHEVHKLVNMAVLPNGDRVKLDGHTRAYMWANKLSAIPDRVVANVWECGTLDDVRNLYSTFDNRDAVESASDQLFGGMRDAKMVFTSPLLKHRQFKESLKLATAMVYQDRSSSVYDQLELWRPELTLLDKANPTKFRFSTGVTAAALISFARYDEDILPFWKDYSAGAGTKMGEEMDAVQALDERISMMRGARKLAGGSNYRFIIGFCLAAIDRHLRGLSYNAGIGSVLKRLHAASLDKWFEAAYDKKAQNIIGR